MIRFLVAAVLALAAGAPALAQDGQDTQGTEQAVEAGEAAAAEAVSDIPVLDTDWAALSGRAVEALESGRVSTPTLDDLRAEIAAFRDVFAEQHSANVLRIRTLRSQIEALGPEEEDGPEIAALRADLAAQLAVLTVPQALAAEARAEADGLISEIDAAIRGRQTDQFLERGPSPLVPTNWLAAVEHLFTGLRAMRGEVTQAWIVQSASPQAAFRAIPPVLTLGVIAFVLLMRGRQWTARLEGAVRTRTLRGRGVWAFFVSLGKVAVPFVGLMAIVGALQATGLMGRRLDYIAAQVPLAGLYPILAHWIVSQLVPGPDRPGASILGLSGTGAGKLGRLFVLMGYAMAVLAMAEAVLTANGIQSPSSEVLLYPVGILVAVIVFRVGRLMRRDVDSEAGQEDIVPLKSRLLRLVGQLTMALALVAVVAGGFGYGAATDRLLVPTVGTLYLFAVLILLQKLVFDIYALIVGASEEEVDGLIPVTIAFLLVFAAAPVVALLWGARVTDLTELWTRFQEGFTLGATQISPRDFLTFVVVFFVGYTLVRLLQGALKSTILPKTRMDVGAQNAVNAGVGYVGIFAAAVVAITTAGIDLSGLAIVAGALSVGIGFGLQNIVSNFVSGIILLIERPISEGDWIDVGGQMGYVRNISVRSTRIETFDRTDVIVPNADLVSGAVTNYTRGNPVGRLILPVGVAYGTDTRRVSEVLEEIARGHPMVLLNPAPSVIFQGFGADSLDFEIRAILRDVNFLLSVKTEMNHQINARFVEEGFEIPFAQRDIWLRNPETLPGQTPDPEEPS